MIERNITDTALEAAYDGIAEAIDATPEDKRPLFLAKLALVLANLVGDEGRIADAVSAARCDL
ncbi:DUF2783 domain-containing protein [Xanthobacter dioxanivorans]|uniref:DUF2783 domain-containing protein n=1 Tax=Xanthobacter dioxanivorans TaxID=2528964 RepID=A0A974SIR7_9HYPH|nr:DUF2783 domain-containing protein [Xanthobacter dioxanivorans]QRG07015.1 DUF2783 domain-containing protein [Xanthobacter dioxanivorans]